MQGSGFTVQGLGFWVLAAWGLGGLGAWGPGKLRLWACGALVVFCRLSSDSSSWRYRVLGLGSKVQGWVSGVEGSGSFATTRVA